MKSIAAMSKLDLSDPFCVYYNILLTNADTTGKQPIPCDYDKTRTLPFLGNASNYFLSFVKFKIDTSSLPVFIPIIESPSTNINNTIYQIGVYEVATTTLSSGTIVWIPQDQTAVAPTLQPVQDTTTNYYYAYDYDYFINLINSTLATHYTASTGDTTGIPYFSLNKSTFNLEFNYSTKIQNGTFYVTMNDALYQLLNTFTFAKYTAGAPTGQAWYKLVPPTATLPVSFQIGAVNFWTMVQNNTSLNVWNPVHSLVFTSNSLPVIPTNVSDDVISTNSLISTAGPADVANIITTFTAQIEANNSYKNQLIYEPTAEYRLVSMSPAGGVLSRMQISVYWKDRYGNTRKLYLNPNCSFSCDILFRRIDFNASTRSMLLQ